MCIIKSGSPCNVIKAWQAFLNEQGCNAGTPDGGYGPHTKSATRCFQRKHGLSIDGIAGQNTLRVAKEYGFVYPAISVPPGHINAVIDISHYQIDPHLDKAKADGILAVFNKATQGVNPKYIDDSYKANRAEAKKLGLLWGAYHFGEAGNGGDQARWFLEHAKPDGDTVLFLDLEHYKHSSMGLEEARDFVQTVFEMTGKYPGLYTNSYLSHLLRGQADPILSKCWLMISAFTCKPRLPLGWDSYALWQYTGHGYVDGLGCIDRDYFNGSEKELREFWEKESV